MGEQDLRVRYCTARTTVTISGTVTIRHDDDGEPSADVERTSEVVLGVEADANDPHWLVPERHWRADRTFDLRLAPDGRLSGAGHTSAGVGPQVLAATVRVALLAGKLAFGLMTVAKAAEAPKPALSDEARAARDRLVARRDRLAAAIDALQARVVEEANLAATDGDPRAVAERVKALDAALALARGEAAAVGAALDRWRTEHVSDWTQRFAHTIGTEQLPVRAAADEWFELDLDDLPGRQVREAARNLGTLVYVVTSGRRDATDHTAPDDEDRIVYRLPSRVQLAVYEDATTDAAPPDGPRRFRLRQLMTAWIVDAYSEVASIPLASGLFSEHGATAEFGDAGTLSHLTNKQTSAAGAVAKAIGEAGSQAVESLDQAGRIQAAFAAPEDPALKALRAQVVRKELEARLATAARTIAGAAPDDGSAA